MEEDNQNEHSSTQEIQKTQENTSFVINETKRPNSLEVGSAGNRIKIYFQEVDDLKTRLKELKDAGILEDSVIERYAI